MHVYCATIPNLIDSFQPLMPILNVRFAVLFSHTVGELVNDCEYFIQLHTYINLNKLKLLEILLNRKRNKICLFYLKLANKKGDNFLPGF